VADVVARDRKEGEKLELTGTPSIFINGRKFESAGDDKDDLEEWIALEIEMNGGTPVNKPAAGAAPPPSAAAAASAPPAPSASAAAGKLAPHPKLKGSAP